MIAGASRADADRVLVPADGKFMIPMDRKGDKGHKPFKARMRDSLIIDQLEIDADLTHQLGIPAIPEKEHLSVVNHGHVDTGKTATLVVCSSR